MRGKKKIGKRFYIVGVKRDLTYELVPDFSYQTPFFNGTNKNLTVGEIQTIVRSVTQVGGYKCTKWYV